VSKESNLAQQAKLLQAVARNGLLRREKDARLVKKVINK
jgi:hypothetical protein